MAGARSGVEVGEDCLPAFMGLRMKRASRFILFKIEGTEKIIVDKTGAPTDGYDAFIEALPESEARYAVYDHEYEKNGCQMSKIVFVFWAPDNCPTRLKMIYSASKQAFRDNLEGIGVEMQANDYDDMDKAELDAKVAQ